MNGTPPEASLWPFFETVIAYFRHTPADGYRIPMVLMHVCALSRDRKTASPGIFFSLN